MPEPIELHGNTGSYPFISICCGQTSIEINKVTAEPEPQRKLFKMILLGPGESGKTTFVKQLQILHQGGFSDEYIESRRALVHYQVKHDILEIMRAMRDLEISYKDMNAEEDAKLLEGYLSERREYQPLFEDLARMIKNLWNDDGVQKCFRRSDEYQLSTSAKYFLDNIDRIATADYLPTYQDILYLRVVTVGVNLMEFNYKESTFRLYDAGGQRSQRKKWIHFFDDVNALIFIVAISEYNQTLREDEGRNRLLESLDLFKEIVNHSAFYNAAIILFLNKIDLFKEKIQIWPLSSLFNSYLGGPDYANAVAYIKGKFQRRYTNRTTLYVYETCATDTDIIRNISDSVFRAIYERALKVSGI